ncbi:MAG: LamG domain-containing protein, partial [Hyphomicrobiales bacterium]|nr:LamG domain-containing protein [Hyphomicrobiales bacterium]
MAYWPIEDLENPVVDVVGGINAPISGNPVYEEGALGAASSSLDFDGSGDYLYMGKQNSLTPPEYTIEAWVKVPAGGGGTVMRSRWSGMALIVDSGGEVRGMSFPACGDGNSKHAVSTTTVDDGQWHHIATTMNASVVKVYIDGGLAGQESTGSTNCYNGGNIAIGREGNHHSGQFDGNIDEVALYGYDLAHGQLAAHYMAAGYELPYRARLQLIARKLFGMEGDELGLVADPVATATGNFVHERVDVEAARGYEGLELRRTYSSLDETTGVFGVGWSSLFDVSMTPDVPADPQTSDVTLRESSGRRV